MVFYTTYGHIYKLVEQVAKGINSVAGTDAVLLQVINYLRRENLKLAVHLGSGIRDHIIQ